MFNTKEEAYVSMIFACAFALLLIIIIIVTAIVYYNRKKKNQQEKQQLQNRYQQELLRTQLEIQEQTLKTISQEIHDNIGQVLSLAKLNLNTMDLAKQAELQEKITDSKNLVSKAIQDLRDLSKSLNTDSIAAMGLLKAIGYELDMIRKTGFETTLETTGELIKIEAQKELIIFRIVQETLNNIMKHAEAKKITVKASYSTDKMDLVIQDDGQGVDLTPLNEDKDGLSGLGIRNMHNRAKMIGADFSMTSALGKGTTVTLSMPFKNQPV